MESVNEYQCANCGATSDDLEEITLHTTTCIPSPIDETESQPPKKLTAKDLWTDAASRLLLELYEQRQQLFGDPKVKKRTIWKEISSELMAHGHQCSPVQTENRWKTMTAAFRRVKDNNNKSGRQRKTCPYEKELEELLGDRPNVEPVCLAASLPMTNSENIDPNSSTAEISDECPSPSAGPSSSGPPAKRRAKESREDRVLAFLAEADRRHEESRDKWRQKKLDAITEVLLNCHREKMQKLDQLLAQKNSEN